MTFKDLEDWQKKLVVKSLKDDENIYIEYTKDDLINSYNVLLKENRILRENAENNDKVVDRVNWENQILKNQQKEFIEWLENESKEVIRDEGYHQRICLGILTKYKEIIGGDSK